MAAYCNWTQRSSHRHGVPAQLLASFNMVLQADVNCEASSPSPKSAVISALLSSVHTATWFGHHKCVDAPVLEKTDDRRLQCCRRGVMLSGWDTSRDSRHSPAGAPSSRLLFHQKTVIHQNRTLLVECTMCSTTFLLSERISQIQEKQVGWHRRDPKREGCGRLTLAHLIWAAKLWAATGCPGSMSGRRNKENATATTRPVWPLVPLAPVFGLKLHVK